MKKLGNHISKKRKKCVICLRIKRPVGNRKPYMCGECFILILLYVVSRKRKTIFYTREILDLRP